MLEEFKFLKKCPDFKNKMEICWNNLNFDV